MPPSSLVRLFPVMSVLLLHGHLGAQALECPAGRVAEISIEAGSIFSEEDLQGEERLLWAYQLANSVHMTTREPFIRRSLLLETGDCLDLAVLEESMRVLREFKFIGNADFSTDDRGNGEIDVLVTTRDEWTTKLALDLRSEDGLALSGASIFEESFLGRGITIGVFGFDRGAEREVGGRLEVPGIGATGMDLLLGGSEGRVGGAFDIALSQPFRGEQPGSAFRNSFVYRRDLFSYVLPEGHQFSHLTVNEMIRRVEVSLARRFGAPGDLYLFGAGLSYERVVVQGGESAEVVLEGDFSDRIEAPPEMAAAVVPQLVDRQAFRVSILAGLRGLRFESRPGLDALTGVQDVAVGREALISMGRSLGGTGTERPGDLFGRAALLAGWSGDDSVGHFRMSAEGRREDSIPGGPGLWRDVLAEGHGIVYLLPREPISATVVLRGTLQAGWRMTAPHQLTLGGADGVRGYSHTAFPGGRRAIGSVEGRFLSPGPLRGLMDLGLTLFADVGGMWKGDSPFGTGSGWRGSAGAGLRIGFPAGTSSVIRVDVAFPVGPGSGSMSPILRISAREWIGLAGQFRDPLMNRSRRVGVSGEYRGVARDGVVP